MPTSAETAHFLTSPPDEPSSCVCRVLPIRFNILNLSVHTVETHRARVMRKLNLRGLPELTPYAVRKEIISLIGEWAKRARTCIHVQGAT